MAAPYNPPKRAEDFQFPFSLNDFASPGSLKSNPTFAAGDFKISKDFGAFANLNTLPDVAPAAGVGCRGQLSATEMTADTVLIVGIDQTVPKEWADFWLAINTT